MFHVTSGHPTTSEQVVFGGKRLRRLHASREDPEHTRTLVLGNRSPQPMTVSDTKTVSLYRLYCCVYICLTCAKRAIYTNLNKIFSVTTFCVYIFLMFLNIFVSN